MLLMLLMLCIQCCLEVHNVEPLTKHPEVERWMIRREHDESRQWNAVDGRGEEINNSNCQLILIDLLTDHTIGFSSAPLSFREYNSSFV